MSRPPKKPKANQILGAHPEPPHPCGVHLTATDQVNAAGVPHRLLADGPLQRKDFVDAVALWLANHHASPDMLARDKERRDALARQGLDDPARERLPTNLTTQKGNWAEIVLAEYLQASCATTIPI